MHARKTVWLLAVSLGLLLFGCKSAPAGSEEYYPPADSSYSSIDESSSASSEEPEDKNDKPQETVYHAITATQTDGCVIEFEREERLVEHGDSLSFTVRITDESYDEKTLLVTANGKVLTPQAENGAYRFTLENVTQPVAVSSSVEKHRYTVTFYPPDALTAQPIEKIYEHGQSIRDEDLPEFFAPDAGYRCVWEIHERSVVKDMQYGAHAYREIADAFAFLSLQGTENAILIADIDFSGVALPENTDGVIEEFRGAFDGNGYALRGITLTSTKSLFGVLLGGKIVDTAFYISFAGVETPLGERKALSCAIVGEMISGEISDCTVHAVYMAKASASAPSAGIVRSMTGGCLSSCTVDIVTPNDDTQTDFVYAVCAYRTANAVISGITVIAGEKMKRFPSDSVD